MGRERKTSVAAGEHDGPDATDEETEESRSAGSELLRKMMGLGLSGFFTTESALRSALGDTVPKEWVEFLSEQSERTREEFTGRLAEEFARVLDGADLVELAGELLEGRTLEVKAEFRLGPRKTSPETKRSERPQRTRKDA